MHKPTQPRCFKLTHTHRPLSRALSNRHDSQGNRALTRCDYSKRRCPETRCERRGDSRYRSHAIGFICSAEIHLGRNVGLCNPEPDATGPTMLMKSAVDSRHRDACSRPNHTTASRISIAVSLCQTSITRSRSTRAFELDWRECIDPVRNKIEELWEINRKTLCAFYQSLNSETEVHDY